MNSSIIAAQVTGAPALLIIVLILVLLVAGAYFIGRSVVRRAKR